LLLIVHEGIYMSDAMSIMLLGLIQGFTEFLPVSSSGHLVIAGHFLGIKEKGATLEIALHAGTLLSVLIYYRKRIADIALDVVRRGADGWSYVSALILGTIPCGIVYIIFGYRIEAAFDQPQYVAVLLCGNGLILLTLLLRTGRTECGVTPANGMLVGLAQAMALLPGISRSGSTIVIGRHLGLRPAVAAEFSFILSIPANAAAILLKCMFGSMGELALWTVLPGVIVSFLSGLLAIALLVRVLSVGKAWWFGVYTLAAGAILVWIL
jgi:undecaprenyl-diphosphatase